ncbi:MULTISPECIES: hypothetical protein [unclassified Kitasatospora]|uniref:hypothetical protein n=1 Tax=unclassified Kitasatospora TaxID=2633591 RepID=UPI00070C2214|nr:MULTISPECIES: hypothetical protein [unclassified Kitasatospora]KQV18676.1 hypothetical protein ASC99_05570 [Kitasatospora sp. Root107]KRB74658.1 hypothetical protein ASE03_19505 [Kitasatospora sp. Root187]
MVLIRLARPFGIAAALTLAVTGTALPASAASDLSLMLEGPAAISIDPTAKPEPHSAGNLPLYIGRVGKEAAKDVVVSYDTRDLTGVAELTLSGQCTVSGTVHTCKQWFPLEYDRINLTENATLTGAKDAKIGAKGVLHIKATSSNAKEAVQDVEVFTGGPKLELKEIPAQNKVKIGSTLDAPIEITNKGSLPANRVILAMYATDGLEFKQRFGNCEYGAESGGGSWTSSAGMICTVDTQVAPGETVKLSPMQFGVTPTALYTFANFHILANVETGTHWMRESYNLKPGSGPRLTFVGKPEAPVATVGGPNIDEDNGSAHNYAELEVHADSSADFSAIAQWTPAAGGRTGKLTVGMLNSGPGSVYDRSGGESAPSVQVVLPKGVTATTVPEKCSAGGHANGEQVKDQGYYTCSTDIWIPNGARYTFEFALALTAEAVNSTVPFSLQNSQSSYEPGHPSAVMSWDKNPANDLGSIKLGEQASGNLPTTTPTKPATTAPTKAPTKAPPAVQPTGTRSASAVPAGQKSSAAPSTSTGPLASTGGGSNAGPIAGAGIAAIVLGAALVVVALRRRRAGAHQ